jgi:hypothetical protein
VATGGTETGGTSTGGTATGGVATGGVATGGTETGGVATGGTETGGVATGGTATGGVATGGTETGGTETGGAETGGAETGGVATGGVETGGVATGGTETGGVGTGGAGSGGEGTGGSGGGGAASFCASGTYAFCDDFEDGDSVGWTQAEQSSGTPGNWLVAADTGRASTPTFDFQQLATNTGHHYQFPSAAAGGPWGDQTVTAWVKPTSAIGDDTYKVGVCARVTGTTGSTLAAYCLFLRTTATSGVLQVGKKVSGGSMGSQTTSSTGVPLFAVGTWYKVTIRVSGSTTVTVTGSINDTPLVVWTDPAATPVLTSGYPGLVTRASGTQPATANFDDVTLTSP